MNVLDQPFLIAAVALSALLASGWLGNRAGHRRRQLAASEREDFGMVIGATLTLLGLIVGFSFSMALSRYDQRKSYEEGEANAIGTAYLRADLLAEADALKVKALLRTYLQARIAFYTASDATQLPALNARTSQLQNELWQAARKAAVADSNPVTALVAVGTNDVLNAQGFAQSAWWNRIPASAWALMMAIAVCATFLVGYNARNTPGERGILLVLPIILSISFYLIADIESPRGGLIRVVPQNLLAAAESIRAAEPNTR